MSSSDSDRVTLSAEELALLNRCKKEAYLFKSAPLAAAASLAYFYSLKFGRLASASRRVRIAVGSTIAPVAFMFGTFFGYGEFFKQLPTLQHSPLLETMQRNSLSGAQPQDMEKDLSAFAGEAGSFPPRESFLSDDAFGSRPRTPASAYDERFYTDPGLSAPVEPKDKGAKFMTYKERREFYRRNPKAEGRVDPLGMQERSANPPPAASQP